MISLMTGLSILWNGCFDMTEEKENGLQEPNVLTIPGTDTYHNHIDRPTFAIMPPTFYDVKLASYTIIYL